MNSQFISNICSIYGHNGKRWLTQLPEITEELCKSWNLNSVSEVKDLSYNYCFMAKNVHNQDVVAKISLDPDRFSKELRALQSFSCGVVKVLGIDTKYSAFLMEKAIPGRQLREIVLSGDDELATRIIAQTIKKIKGIPAQSRFKHLSEFIPTLDILRHRLSTQSLDKLQQLFKDLTSDRKDDILLHGDLHHGNILSHGDSWIAIDPHGYIGHPVAEIGAMIRNPWDAFPSDLPLKEIIERRICILHEELNYDIKLINAWAYCITALSEVWSIQDQGNKHEVDLQLLGILELGVR